MSLNFSISNYFFSHAKLAEKVNVASIEKAIEIIKDVFEADKKIFTCGNGGSASTASHFITDWNKMINLRTGKKFRGISLCDNVGLVTAFGNDLSFNDIFSGQIEAIMDEGDLLVAISGSGNSENVIRAIQASHRAGGKVLGVVGYDGGKILHLCDYNVWVPSFDMQLCEDVHLMFGHMVMKAMCSDNIR